MKTRKTNWVVLAIMVAITAIAAFALKSKDGECAWCPSYACFGSCFSQGCVCVTPPGETKGSCYGVQMKEFFENKGYNVQ